MEKSREMETLELFLNKPVASSRSVMREFAKLDGAVVHLPRKRGGFVYVPGTREDRVLLVARADTVWDSCYNYYEFSRQKPVFRNGSFVNSTGESGIGANNRAGCALVYLLHNLEHSVLILDRQEYGFRLGTYEIWAYFHDMFDELNRHRYMIEFDLCGADGLKYYDMPASEDFRRYLSDGTGFREVPYNGKGSTDICELAHSICGVNVSAGYFNESTPRERLDYSLWLNTYEKFSAILSGEQPHFEEYWIDDLFDENEDEE